MSEPRLNPRARNTLRRHVPLTATLSSLALVLAACAAPAASVAPPDATTAPTTAASEGAPEVVATGDFHDVDGSATGMVQLKHLADGSFAVVFEQFNIASTDHTNVVMVTNADVAATTDVDQSAILDLGPLKGTSGMQDYPVPAEMSADAMGYHTVVLWDTTMLRALAAAPLAEP